MCNTTTQAPRPLTATSLADAPTSPGGGRLQSRPPPSTSSHPTPHNQTSCPRYKYRSHDQQVPFSRLGAGPGRVVLERPRGWPRSPGCQPPVDGRSETGARTTKVSACGQPLTDGPRKRGRLLPRTGAVSPSRAATHPAGAPWLAVLAERVHPHPLAQPCGRALARSSWLPSVVTALVRRVWRRTRPPRTRARVSRPSPSQSPT